MIKQITLSETEYENLVLKRKELKQEVKAEYHSEVRTPAIMVAISMLIFFAWGYSVLLEGYSTFPKLTLIASFFVLVFYCLSIAECYSVLKKRFAE